MKHIKASCAPRPLAALILSLLCATQSVPASGQIYFTDEAQARGIDFVWAPRWLGGDLGGGVALEDLDDDGDLDVFLATKGDAPMRVYRNDGAGFVDVSDQVGVGAGIDIKQILFADLDNDGRRDMILSAWIPTGAFVFSGGTLRIYRNLGGGEFEDFSSSPVDSLMPGRPTGVSAGDFDLDGDLDLYVSMWKGGPPDPTSRNRLLRNDGSFSFVDVATALGVDDFKKSYQPIFTDLSGDGWLDIVVAEDKKGGMTYYESDGEGGFVDRTVDSGLDGYIGPEGTEDGDLYIDGMGVTVEDYDGDGDFDLYVTNIFDGNVLYQNENDGTFTEVAVPTGTVNYRVGWGCAFVDIDHDGWMDLYVADFGMGTQVATDKLDRVYRNNGNRTFTDVGPEAGVTYPDDGFGVATGDLDRDGDLDIVVTNGDAPARLYVNRTENSGHWIHTHLVGTESNRDGVGAIVTVSVGERTFVREQRAGTSYLSFDSHALEFGLGDATLVDRIEVRWPSGVVDEWFDLPVNARVLLVEGGNATVSNADGDAGTPPARDDLRYGVEVGPAIPNPFNPRTELRFRVPDGVPVQLRVVDLAGRVVRRLARPGASGWQSVIWDGNDDAGRAVASGNYRFVVRAGDRRASTPLTLVR